MQIISIKYFHSSCSIMQTFNTHFLTALFTLPNYPTTGIHNIKDEMQHWSEFYLHKRINRVKTKDTDAAYFQTCFILFPMIPYKTYILLNTTLVFSLYNASYKAYSTSQLINITPIELQLSLINDTPISGYVSKSSYGKALFF